MRTYTMRLERIEDGWWLGTIVELQGVFTDGRTIAAVRRRIREAMHAADAADWRTAAIRETYALPAPVLAKVRHARKVRAHADTARQRAETAQAASRKAVASAAGVLFKLGLSNRDAAEFLGMSHERLRQVTGKAAR